MTDEEPLLTCGDCGCEITVAEDRDNAGLCDDCEMDFDDDMDDHGFDDGDCLSECDVCGVPMTDGEYWSLRGLCDECFDLDDDDNDE